MFDLLGATVTPSATELINKTAFLFAREKIMTTLALNIQTMSSREIADLTGKRHDNVMQVISSLITAQILTPEIQESTYS